MPKRGKTPAADRRGSEAADILARNVAALFKHAKAHHDRDRSTAVLFEDYVRRQRWGDSVGKSTIYRMRNGDPGIAVGLIDVVARAFGLSAWHLLFPGLDPVNPPVLMATDAEKQLYAEFKELQRRLRSAPDVEETEREGVGEGSSNAGDHASGKGSKGNHTPQQRRPRAAKPAVVGRRHGGRDRE